MLVCGHSLANHLSIMLGSVFYWDCTVLFENTGTLLMLSSVFSCHPCGFDFVGLHLSPYVVKNCLILVQLVDSYKLKVDYTKI